MERDGGTEAEKGGTEAGYARLRERHEEARTALAARSRRLSSTRGVTFLAMVAAVVAVDFLEGSGETLAVSGLVALGIAFVVQIAVHRRVRREERWVAALSALAREGVLRAGRRWGELEEALPAGERTFAPAAPGHPYASDLDMVGRASLARLLGPVTSRRARETLAAWLLHPGSPAAARARQEALRELVPHRALRHAFAAHGRIEAPDQAGSLDEFVDWAEADEALEGHTALRWAAVLLPPLFVAGVWADLFLGAGPWWLLPLFPLIGVARRAASVAEAGFSAVARAAGPARALVPQLHLLDGTGWEGRELATVRARLGAGAEAAHRHLATLLRLIDWVESRRNIVYATIAPLLLVDVHLAAALDRWRVRHGRALRGWLDAAATFEALSALSTLADDHPDWTFPELIEDGAPVFRAAALGHPLLPPDRCVRNDVEVGPPGTFLLVTGSNMSGKSTLLRAIGLNAVLAAAGGPVAAEGLSTPCLRVFTSMRIEDSLEEGVSLFMAELLRIRGVVEAAMAPDPEGRPVLYLLDEMLHGTNTAERRVAARGIVHHLLRAGAIGAVSTHDLLLAETPELVGAAHSVHFREEVEGRAADGRPRIHFDYRMRPGIATTRNALKLLEAVGLSLPEEGGPAAGEGGSGGEG